MRNMNRLRMEVSALRNRYGRNNVTFHSGGDWIELTQFSLPQGVYTLNTATLLIIIPPNYDAAKISEVYVDRDLRLRQGNKRLPHVHNRYQTEYRNVGYEWLCFETPQGPNEGLIGFISTLRAYFTDPHAYVAANE